MSEVYGVTFNGVHNSSLGIVLVSAPRPIMANTKDEYIQIPEMNGSFLVEDNTRQDIVIEASFFLKRDTREAALLAAYAVGDWLTTTGRKQLIFDDCKGLAYNAKASTGVMIDTTEGFEEILDFTVTFQCDPIMKEVV